MRTRTTMSLSLLALLLMITMISGCGGKEFQPEAINEEVDKCEVCNMQVKDDGYAVQLITTDGKAHKFDDLGCMNEWKRANSTADIAVEFVRDHNSLEWVNLEKATYAYDATFETPMAYGIVSFKKVADAEKFIAEQGKGTLLTATELESHTWEANHDMMDMDMDMEQHNEHDHDHGSDNTNMNDHESHE